MKKSNLFTVITVLTFALFFAACGNPAGSSLNPGDNSGNNPNSNPGGPDTVLGTYTATKSGATYTLIVNKGKAKAAVGNGYELTIAKSSVNSVSTGSVVEVTENLIVLKPSSKDAPSFSAGLNGSKITNISGTITLDNGTREQGPGSLASSGGGGGGGGGGGSSSSGTTTTTPTTPATPATVSVSGVTLAPSTLNLTLGGSSATLAATIAPSNATNKSVTWTSSNTGVATVNNGTVTAVAVGTATITVKTQDGSKTATCSVTVNPAGTSLLTGTVSITGNAAKAGDVLTANTSSLDGNGAISYQWKRGDSAEAAIASSSSIGSGSTYTVTVNDLNKFIAVTVSRDGYSGSATSAAVGPVAINVNFSVTADGHDTQTTTQLFLTFSPAFPGLTANDITLSGVSGAGNISKTLSGSGASYTLTLGNVTAGGTLTVTLAAKSGYIINGSPATVSIFNVTPVTFNSVTANGSSTQTTTQLTLTFSQAISGLSAGDIELSGVSGVVNIIKTLSGSGPSYILTLDNVTAGGSLNLAIAKAGYTISDSPRTVTIYYAAPVTFNSVTANGSSTQTTTQLSLNFSQEIFGLSAEDIELNGVPDVQKGNLSGSGSTYTLPISGFSAGGTLTVAVTKEGYTISGSSKTVTIYHYTAPVSVNFNVQIANPPSQTTTELILTFSKVIPGLSADDITLSGVSGVKKGTLTLTPSGYYTLPINGVTADGTLTLTVSVAKSGYIISNSPQTVTIYHYTPITSGVVPGNTLTEKVTWLKTNAVNGGDYIIEQNANETTTPQYLSFSYGMNVTITLKGIGANRTISLSENGALFTVGQMVTLILDNNITLQGRNNNYGSLVGGTGTLIMNPGSTITGNTASETYGGGVSVSSTGTFIMNGGTISNNTSGCGRGGGVFVASSGSFTMNGGSITNNSSVTSNSPFSESSSRGGGVHVEMGAFTMNGGTISGNTAKNGGGVHIGSSKSFTMNGGTISGNTASEYGGGVEVYDTPFIKTGGTITGYASDKINGNVVKDSSGTIRDRNGHAVFVLFSSGSDGIGGISYKHKESTAGTGLNLDSSKDAGWDQDVSGAFSRINVTFAGDTSTVTFRNLINNDIYLVKVNTSATNTPIANTGSTYSMIPRNSEVFSTDKDFTTRGHSGAEEFNANPPPLTISARTQRSLPQTFSVGDVKTFWVETYINSLSFIEKPASLLASGTYSNIWVIDNGITSVQAQTLAAQFDVIYPAQTNLLGYEYGGGPGGNGGIDGDKKVQILVYDFLSSTGGDTSTIGFFWGKDHYLRSTLTGSLLGSNEAEMFYINATYVRTQPSTVYSTLVHEFQHMINWNMKYIRTGTSSPTWFNEMLSLMSEEVMANIIGVNPLQEINSRMPRFLGYYFSNSFTQWSNDLYNYSNKMAFGGYLLRNYGGAEILQKIMANNMVGEASITAALKEISSELDFKEALLRFGEALIFNHGYGDAKSFKNTVTKNINGYSYTVQGLDIWSMSRTTLYTVSGGPFSGSFRPTSGQGPFVFNSIQPTELTTMLGHSISLHSLDEWKNKTGTYSITLQRPSNSNIELILMVK